MGCFCRRVVVPPIPPARAPASDDEPADQPSAPPLIAAISEALAARWLPAAEPWEPDPDWLKVPIPTVPMSPATLSTVMRLVHAREAIRLTLKLDPLQPAEQTKLARIVATLNERAEELEPLADDRRPWSALARMNSHVDTVEQALADGLLDPDRPPEEAAPLAPWRPFLAQLKPVLPIIAIVNMLELDLDDPLGALDRLRVTVRTLRKVMLPPLKQPLQVMQIIARSEAVKRLEDSLGEQPFEEMREKVERKAKAVQEQLPRKLALGPTGQVEGLPPLPPNPSAMINAPTVAALGRLSREFVSGLDWNVSVQRDPPLLAAGTPVAALVKGGVGEVRSSPCDRDCDAARALARSQAATTSPDSGTGAGPGG